ncbi:MAG: hypothetical protein IJC04_09615, partial [Oscillospiraceae bacterium]|nr:hypothetical protein [Oscillospiraceae bacterium]
TLTAVAAENYTFTNWVINGENGATEATTTVTVTAATTISAVFTAVEEEPEEKTAGWADNGDGSYTYTSVLGLPAEGDAEGTERDPSTDEAINLIIDLDDYLADGKTREDIVKITADFVVGNGIGGGFCVGAKESSVGAEDGWKQIQVGESGTYSLETPNGIYNENDLQFSMWWAEADTALTVSNIQIEYAEEIPAGDLDVWVENEDGSYTLTAGDAASKPALKIDFAELLDEDKTAEDVASISVDIALSGPAGSAGGGFGGHQGTIVDEETGSDWVQVSYPVEGSTNNTVTLELDGGLGEGEAEVQVWWIGEGDTATVSNITINYYHNVTIAEDIEYGTVEADVEKAVEGDTVTLTVKADVGYDLEQLVVTYEDEEGEPQTVEVAKDYTFVMPAADVTVDATFVEHIYPFVIIASDESNGVFDKWEDAALFIANEELDYTIIVNKDVELSTKFTLPKKANSLEFTGEGSLTFTGTKLAVPVDTMFNVKLAAKNKTNLIDITVAKDCSLEIWSSNEQPQFINKITGTKTSQLHGNLKAASISTFQHLGGTIYINNGKMTGIGRTDAEIHIAGENASAAITEYVGSPQIYINMNEDGTLPKVTVDTIADGSSLNVVIYDAQGYEAIVASGTTILYSKNDISKNITVTTLVLEGDDPLTAYYYAKTKSIKAEVGTALNLYTGTDIEEKTLVGNYPNFELLFEEITDPAVDYIIEVNTDLTLDTKFALPKKAASITFIGEGTLTFTGTKLTVPYNVTINEGVVINVDNKKCTMDIAVGKGATLENFGEIIGINKLSGTKTSNLDGNFVVNNLATFDNVYADVMVMGGKVTAVNVLDGGLAIYGAKASAAIKTATVNAKIYLIREDGVLPKVTLEGIGEAIEDDTTIQVLVTDGLVSPDPATLTSGTVILYTKKADFADKINIVNNDGNLKAYTYGKVIKAEYPQAVTVDNLNTTGEEGSENNAELEKDYPNFESAVAAIDAAKDNTAEYVITLNKNIAPEKFALPKYAASVTITSEIGAMINVGKVTAITANTDLTLEHVGFETATGKLVTINAKKNLTVNELFGAIAAIKGGAKSTLTCVAEFSSTYRPDITGFGKVVVCDTLTTGNNFNVTELVLGTSETGAGTLVVSASTKKSSIKALDATNGGRIEYAEGAKALTFTGKDDAFKVSEDDLTISGEVVNGQAVLTTKTVDPEKLAVGIAPANEDVEYGFTQMGNNICYMGKVLEVSFGEEGSVAYATWGEVVEVIEEANNAEGSYIITLLDDYNANAAIKFPKAGTYEYLTIISAQDYDDEETEMFNFNFTGNLTLTGYTEFYAVNLGAVKNGAPAKYTINGGKNYIYILNCDTGLLTSLSGGEIDIGLANADKIKADDLSIIGDVKAIGGITAKNVEFNNSYNLVMNQGSKLAVTGDVTVYDEDCKLTVTILDKKTGEPATLKNNYVVATIKGDYAPDSIVLNETAHAGYTLELVKGKLVAKLPAAEWTENDGTYTAVASNEFSGSLDLKLTLSDFLEEEKTLADIRSISFDVVTTGGGWANGCIGANKTDTDDDESNDWTSVKWDKDTETVTIESEVGFTDTLFLQVWYMQKGDTATFSNMKITYVGEEPEEDPEEDPEEVLDQWVVNEDGTITYKSNEDGTTTKPQHTVPLTLAEGKTAADVESISVDFVVTGTANGGIGVNQGKEYTNEEDELTHWVQTSYPAAEGNTVTLAVEEGLQSASETLLIQIYWSDGNAFEITISNITINYATNNDLPEIGL